MQKVVINVCYGGFGLSEDVMSRYNDLTSKNVEYRWEIERDDPVLIQVIEEVGLESAGSAYAELKIVEVPDGVKWHIYEYDGMEHVAEEHRTWY
jgi:hypothetical protein